MEKPEQEVLQSGSSEETKSAKSLWDEELDRCGEVTFEEAHQIASRFNASHWHRSRPTGGEVARYSIPADPLRDDDIRLRAFIRNAQRTAEALKRAHHLLHKCEHEICSCTAHAYNALADALSPPPPVGKKGVVK